MKYLLGNKGFNTKPHITSFFKDCKKLIADWENHKGRVVCYGDATGGAGGSAKVKGSDWDLIKEELHPVFGQQLYI